MRTRLFIWMRDLTLWVYGYKYLHGDRPGGYETKYMTIHAMRRNPQRYRIGGLVFHLRGIWWQLWVKHTLKPPKEEQCLTTTQD
jgi:hypothetical protein